MKYLKTTPMLYDNGIMKQERKNVMSFHFTLFRSIARSTWWIWLTFYNDRIPQHHNRRGTCYSKSVNKIKYDTCICTLAINMLFYSCARSSQFGYICITTYMIFQRCVFPLLHTKLMTANFFYSTPHSILYEQQPPPLHWLMCSGRYHSSCNATNYTCKLIAGVHPMAGCIRQS
jgi:hypothetical protein